MQGAKFWTEFQLVWSYWLEPCCRQCMCTDFFFFICKQLLKSSCTTLWMKALFLCSSAFFHTKQCVHGVLKITIYKEPHTKKSPWGTQGLVGNLFLQEYRKETQAFPCTFDVYNNDNCVLFIPDTETSYSPIPLNVLNSKSELSKVSLNYTFWFFCSDVLCFPLASGFSLNTFHLVKKRSEHWFHKISWPDFSELKKAWLFGFYNFIVIFFRSFRIWSAVIPSYFPFKFLAGIYLVSEHAIRSSSHSDNLELDSATLLKLSWIIL